MCESSHMSDLSMLQLKYRDCEEIIRQDLICRKIRLPKTPPQTQKKEKTLFKTTSTSSERYPLLPCCILC